MAVGFETEQGKMGQKECYFSALAEELEPKRNAMAKFLSEAGMKPTIPDGGYFMMADYSNLGKCYSKLLFGIIIIFFFFLNIFGGHIHMSYFGATDTPVLDFW